MIPRGSNGVGTHTVDVRRELDAYDRLPPMIRRALREARVEIDALSIERQVTGLRARPHVVEAIAADIRAQAEEIARQEERRLYSAAPREQSS